jgi:hypothetical protein
MMPNAPSKMHDTSSNFVKVKYLNGSEILAQIRQAAQKLKQHKNVVKVYLFGKTIAHWFISQPHFLTSRLTSAAFPSSPLYPVTQTASLQTKQAGCLRYKIFAVVIVFPE